MVEFFYNFLIHTLWAPFIPRGGEVGGGGASRVNASTSVTFRAKLLPTVCRVPSLFIPEGGGGRGRCVPGQNGHLHTDTDTEPKRGRCVPGQNGHLQRRNDTEPKCGPLYTTAIGKGDAGSGERHKETQESHRETQARGRVTGRRRLGGTAPVRLGPPSEKFPNEKSYWGLFFEKRGLPDRSFFGEIQGERLRARAGIFISQTDRRFP